jgi:hypothetical protein
VGLELNGKHQLRVYADDIILLGDNINTTKNTETLIDACKEVALEINAEKLCINCLITSMQGKIII